MPSPPAPHQLLPLSDLAATQCFDSTPVFSIASTLFSHFCHTESPVIPVESAASTHLPITTEGVGGERTNVRSILPLADVALDRLTRDARPLGELARRSFT